MGRAVGRRPRELANGLWPLLVAVMIAGAALAALGRPNVVLARDFLTSSHPDHAGALATVEVIVWAMVTGLFLVQVAEAVRRSPPIRAQARRRRIRAQVALLSGLLVFVGGGIHHQADAGSLCCGDVARADRLAR